MSNETEERKNNQNEILSLANKLNIAKAFQQFIYKISEETELSLPNNSFNIISYLTTNTTDETSDNYDYTSIKKVSTFENLTDRNLTQSDKPTSGDTQLSRLRFQASFISFSADIEDISINVNQDGISFDHIDANLSLITLNTIPFSQAKNLTPKEFEKVVLETFVNLF